MSGYENAPATKLLATRCAICSRPLVDAASVEAGIGPDCREKYGYNIEVDPVLRERANSLVHFIAVEQTGVAVARAIQQLRELGFKKLAFTLAVRLFQIQIKKAQDSRLEVVTPYTEAGVEALRSVPGRRWDAENKVNTFPESSKAQLWAALKKGFPSYWAVGPEGQLFEIPGLK